MSFFLRPQTIADVARHIRAGGDPGYEIKDFLHEFQDKGSLEMLLEKPPGMEDTVADGKRWNAFLQALAVHLAGKLNCDPPEWTWPPIRIMDPWFASPGTAMRNYLLISSPAPFRTRNIFIDEDSLRVI